MKKEVMYQMNLCLVIIIKKKYSQLTGRIKEIVKFNMRKNYYLKNQIK